MPISWVEISLNAKLNYYILLPAENLFPVQDVNEIYLIDVDNFNQFLELLVVVDVFILFEWKVKEQDDHDPF